MIASENKNSTDRQKVDFEKSVTTMIGPHRAEDGHKHWAKVLEIREKLKGYSS